MVSKLEAQCHTMKTQALANKDSQAEIASVDKPSVAPVHCAPAVPKQPQGMMTVSRKWSHKSKPTMVHHQPVHISNCFSPLSDTPAEKPTLIFGSSVLRNMKLRTVANIVKCTSGERASLNPIYKSWLRLNVTTVRVLFALEKKTLN